MARQGPFLFYLNRDEPIDVRSRARAQSGRIVMLRYRVAITDIGKKVSIAFRAASASHVLAWKALATAGNPFAISSLGGGVTGSNLVLFTETGGISYQNEVLGQDADIAMSLPDAFNYWRGMLNLEIVG